MPMCLWFMRSDSSAAQTSARLDSWLSGRSTDVATLRPVVPRCGMEWRMASDARNWLASALSSRNTPSTRCSVSMRAAELAGFIAGEKDGSPGLFAVALEHIRTLLQNDRVRGKRDLV